MEASKQVIQESYIYIACCISDVMFVPFCPYMQPFLSDAAVFLLSFIDVWYFNGHDYEECCNKMTGLHIFKGASCLSCHVTSAVSGYCDPPPFIITISLQQIMDTGILFLLQYLINGTKCIFLLKHGLLCEFLWLVSFHALLSVS